MPRLPVRNFNAAHFEYFDNRPPHVLLRTPSLRVVVQLLIGPDPANTDEDNRRPIEAILDTGAPISLFPHFVWSRFPRDVYELLNPANLPLGETHPSSAVLGREYRYDFARLAVGVADDAGRRLRAVPVIAQFMHDGHPLKRSVVGLSASVLTNRVLRRQYDADGQFEQEWWLQEA